MTATNKRLLISESRDDSNQCTPCRGKLDQHATHFPHSVSVWSKTIRISHGPHIAIFHTVVNRFEQIHCTREEGLPTQSTVHRLTDLWVHTQLLSHNNNGAVGKSQASVDNQLLGLPGPYHWHAIGTFNACSRGPTHQSLIDTGGGYNLGGANLPHTTPRLSQPAVSTLHLRAPPDLQFNQVPSIKPKC
jgi:hypothetical protein